MTSRVSAILVLAHLVCFSSACELSPHFSPDDILDGQIDLDDPAVVALVRGHTVYCTGTLIAPDVVVTAAHCIELRGRTIVPDEVLFGAAFETDEQERIPAAWTQTHADYNASSFKADVGLVGLTHTSSTDPVAVNSVPMNERIGDSELRFVGFGFLAPGPEGGTGVKYFRESSILEVGEEFFSYRQVTCHGDSGGPALLIEEDGAVIMGTTSHGPVGCFDVLDSFSLRSDLYFDWIEEGRLLKAAECGGDGRCVVDCYDEDPDCHNRDEAAQDVGLCDLPGSDTIPECAPEPVEEPAGGCSAVGRGAGAGTQSWLALLLVVITLSGRRQRRASRATTRPRATPRARNRLPY
jgi:hypothetical protein